MFDGGNEKHVDIKTLLISLLAVKLSISSAETLLYKCIETFLLFVGNDRSKYFGFTLYFPFGRSTTCRRAPLC